MTIILFRKDFDNVEEMEIAKRSFDVIEHRTDCSNFPAGLVIGRYSCLPYYADLEHDLRNLGYYLINSYKQHCWIANFEYYDDLKEFTPQSWDDNNFWQCEYQGPFVVKGKTNSRKWDWNKLMFAPDKKTASMIAAELSTDGLIGPQGIIYRKYIPLKIFEIGLNGLPFTNEYRFFYFKTTRLTGAYYWSVADKMPPGVPSEAIEFADKIAQEAAKHVNFFVLDVAEKEDGGWILIEVNDGQCSGLSENPAYMLYSNLKFAIEGQNEENTEVH